MRATKSSRALRRGEAWRSFRPRSPDLSAAGFSSSPAARRLDPSRIVCGRRFEPGRDGVLASSRAMKFEQLDRRMRVYETAHDHCVLPGIHMVARIDGRSFSQLTRSPELAFDAPYDLRFRDCMVATLEHLVTKTGFSVLFGYTQSDEMSLLFRKDESLFGRKLRKFLSVLAGEASAKFSVALGTVAAFDARILAAPRHRRRRRLLSLASRGRASQRAERALVLAAPPAGARRPRGDGAAEGRVRRRSERAALPRGDQLQRRAGVAEAGHRSALGERGARRDRPADGGRDHLDTTTRGGEARPPDEDGVRRLSCAASSSVSNGLDLGRRPSVGVAREPQIHAPIGAITRDRSARAASPAEGPRSRARSGSRGCCR